MRPRTIRVPIERPQTCAACPLLGRRPMSELSHGERYTLRCMMPGVQRFLSGRGSKATDPENRYRCKPKEYLRMRDDYAGDVPISATDYERYQMGRDAWLFERDKQNGKTT